MMKIECDLELNDKMEKAIQLSKIIGCQNEDYTLYMLYLRDRIEIAKRNFLFEGTFSLKRTLVFI